MQTESLNLLMYFFAVSVFYRLEHIIILSIYYVTVQSRTVTLKELCKIQYGMTFIILLWKQYSSVVTLCSVGVFSQEDCGRRCRSEKGSCRFGQFERF